MQCVNNFLELVSSDARGNSVGPCTRRSRLAIETRRETNAAAASPDKPVAPPSATPIRVGDTGLGSQPAKLGPDRIAQSGGESGNQLGVYRMRLPSAGWRQRDVGGALPVGMERPAGCRSPNRLTRFRPLPQVGLELDIRGATVEEMLPRLENTWTTPIWA